MNIFFCHNIRDLISGWINAIVSFFLVLGSIGLVFLGSTGLLVAQTPEGRLEAISWIVVGSIYIMYFSIYFIAGIGLVLAVKHVRNEKSFFNNLINFLF